MSQHLDGHHYIEETSMFPNIEEAMKKQKDENLEQMKTLYTDHEEMKECMNELHLMFSNQKFEEILSKWKKFENHMKKHFIEEEDITIPAIIKYGTNV